MNREISNCCEKPVLPPDICSDCKEHCEVIKAECIVKRESGNCVGCDKNEVRVCGKSFLGKYAKNWSCMRKENHEGEHSEQFYTIDKFGNKIRH